MNPIRPQSAAETTSVQQLGDLLEVTINQRKPAEDLHGSDDIRLQPRPGEALDIIPRVSRLDGETSDRVRAMESRTKRRSSRGFARFLVAICIGVAGTLAWQSYGGATKQIIATSAPELGWSPEAKEMIARWVQQLGWTKPLPGPENAAVRPAVSELPQAAPVAQTTPQMIAPKAPVAPSVDPEQVQQITQSLAALRQTVEQLAAGQDQIAREIKQVLAADMELLSKIPAPPQPPAAPARKPIPAPPSSSRATTPALTPHP